MKKFVIPAPTFTGTSFAGVNCIRNPYHLPVIPAEAGIHSFVMIFLDSRFHGNDKCGAFSFLYGFLILMIIGFNWFSEFSVKFLLICCKQKGGISKGKNFVLDNSQPDWFLLLTKSCAYID
ncbi:TPA: hypothetical protein ENX78_16850 [Candidatus Poribacteria bacterium]|nr:hypothetical protein [Candidatus Poribacteria bacterium]